MDAADARLITDLADRIRAAGPPAKDPDAERLIFEQIGRTPDSLYVLVQAVLLQEQALCGSQDRIAELEHELESRAEPAPRRGFLDSLLGGGEPETPAPRQGAAHAQQAPPAAAAPARPQPGASGPVLGAPAASGGGGFLRTAAAGALGVAGGVLLASSISNLFTGDGAQNAGAQGEPRADAEQAAYDQGAADQAAQDGGGWDAGGWDGGGWDV